MRRADVAAFWRFAGGKPLKIRRNRHHIYDQSCPGPRRSWMIRLLFCIVFLAALFYATRAIWRELARRDIDWTGVTFAFGFVAMAFYLRHVTGMG
jgi:ABC-type Co2+ transport system permease subunit